METVANAVTGLASKALGLGTQNQQTSSGTEPVSGELGKGTAGEPYDAGNRQDTEHSGRTGIDSDAPSFAAKDSTSAIPSGSYATQQTAQRDISSTTGTVGGTKSDEFATPSSEMPSQLSDHSAEDSLSTSYKPTGQMDTSTHASSGVVGERYTSQDYPSGRGELYPPSSEAMPSSNDQPKERSGSLLDIGEGAAATSGSHTNTLSREAQGLTGGGFSGINVTSQARPDQAVAAGAATSFQDENQTFQAGGGRPTEANEARRNYNVGGFGTVEPSVGADPESGAVFHQKQQGADRPSEVPSEEQTEAIRESKQRTESLVEGDPSAPRRNYDENEGTGTKYVKSTGVAAEGGDFDATRPGAGKEADRLLEQQGIRREINSTNPLDPSQEHHGLGQKLKEKLHLGKK